VESGSQAVAATFHATGKPTLGPRRASLPGFLHELSIDPPLLGEATVAATLERALTAIKVDGGALPAALNALPQRPDLIVGPLALTLTTQAVTAYRRLAAANAAAYEPDLAGSLNNLSVRLAEAGRRAEGLETIEEAVTVRRRLAAANAAAYEPDLARLAEQPLESAGGGGAPRRG
jgi:hypothetical protein